MPCYVTDEFFFRSNLGRYSDQDRDIDPLKDGQKGPYAYCTYVYSVHTWSRYFYPTFCLSFPSWHFSRLPSFLFLPSKTRACDLQNVYKGVLLPFNNPASVTCMPYHLGILQICVSFCVKLSFFRTDFSPVMPSSRPPSLWCDIRFAERLRHHSILRSTWAAHRTTHSKCTWTPLNHYPK